MRNIIQLTDAGRGHCGFGTERKDCTVRALAKFASLPYDTAHRIAAEAGRRAGHGIHIEHVIEHARKYGVTCRRVDLRQGRKVYKFAEDHPRGRYLLRISGHVLTLVDGVLFDINAEALTSIVRFYFTTEAR